MAIGHLHIQVVDPTIELRSHQSYRTLLPLIGVAVLLLLSVFSARLVVSDHQATRLAPAIVANASIWKSYVEIATPWSIASLAGAIPPAGIRGALTQ